MKPLQTIAGAALLALAASAAQAQTAPAPADGGQPRVAAPADREPGRRPPLTVADREAFTDARIAGIQAGLKLTPEQRNLWSPVEAALRAQAAARAERVAAREADRTAERPDLMQRLDRRAARVKERAEGLQGLASAMRPFWASLDEAQKRRLPLLLRTARAGGEGRHAHGRHHHGRHGIDGGRRPG